MIAQKNDAKRETWAIVPARRGSKGFPNKNIALFQGKPLLCHAIDFAKKLSWVHNIFVSTDSPEYAEIARETGAWVPFLRSNAASSDTAMEADVLADILSQCELSGITPPSSVVWLRPTTPLRHLSAFDAAYEIHRKTRESVCLAAIRDSRILLEKGDYLVDSPFYPLSHSSMVRRQDSPDCYQIFFGEVFSFPSSAKSLQNYLGSKVRFVTIPKQCAHDIDLLEDLLALERLVMSDRTYAQFVF